MFHVRLAVAGHAGVHCHGRPFGASPDITGIAADSVFLVWPQGVGSAVIAVALFALQVAAFDVGDVREVDVLGLARVDQPLGFALRRHIAIDKVLFGHGGPHGGGMAAGALIQCRNAGEGAVGAKRMAVVALRSGLIGVDLVAEIHRLLARPVDHTRKAGPTRSQGGQHSDKEYDSSAKFHGLALSEYGVLLA